MNIFIDTDLIFEPKVQESTYRLLSKNTIYLQSCLYIPERFLKTRPISTFQLAPCYRLFKKHSVNKKPQLFFWKITILISKVLSLNLNTFVHSFEPFITTIRFSRFHKSMTTFSVSSYSVRNSWERKKVFFTYQVKQVRAFVK